MRRWRTKKKIHFKDFSIFIRISCTRTSEFVLVPSRENPFTVNFPFSTLFTCVGRHLRGVQRAMKIFRPVHWATPRDMTCALSAHNRSSNSSNYEPKCYSAIVDTTHSIQALFVMWKTHDFFSVHSFGVELGDRMNWREWRRCVGKIFHNLLNLLPTWSRKAPNIFQYSMHFLLYDAASDERRARIRLVLNVLSAKELKMHNFSSLQDEMTLK